MIVSVDGRVFKGWFGPGDVEQCGDIGSFPQNVDHGGFVDGLSTTGVDEGAVWEHLLEVTAFDHFFCCGQVGDVIGHNDALCECVVEAGGGAGVDAE